jgi:antitoxin FitA
MQLDESSISAEATMTVITVPLSDEQLERLRVRARQAGMAPEDLVRASLEEWLSVPGKDFAEAARYVLQKNAELYRRLA